MLFDAHTVWCVTEANRRPLLGILGRDMVFQPSFYLIICMERMSTALARRVGSRDFERILDSRDPYI